MDKKLINYSQCWEDPRVLLEAFSIKPDDRVLSITSGGDNSLALLLAGAKKVDSVDLNPAQNYLLELKICAATHLVYNEYLELMGVIDSERRAQLFSKIEAHIPSDAREWWAGHRGFIDRGVVHSGRFEKFTIFFARYVLPLIHSKKTISAFLSCRTIEEQRTFYETRWDSMRWRFFFALASNRIMLKRFARQRGMFAHAGGETVADIYRNRLERHLMSVSVEGNYFLHYSLTGRYGIALPPYLEEQGYRKLRDAHGSILSVTSSDLLSYLRSTPADVFSKFNLSDIFEALSSDDNDALWIEIIRTSKQGAIVAYWNNLVQRSYPSKLSAWIKTDGNQLNDLRAKDRVFFYDNLHVHTILK